MPAGRSSAWLERLVRDQEAGGSNPLAPIFAFVNRAGEATAQLASVWNEIDLYHEHADFDRCADLIRHVASGVVPNAERAVLVGGDFFEEKPSTYRPAFGNPTISRPSCRTIDERTSSVFQLSPSMAEDLTTSNSAVA